MDLRLSWSIDWLTFRTLLTPRMREHEWSILADTWPYFARITNRQQQHAEILLAKFDRDAKRWIPNRHPLKILIGALCEIAYEMGVDPFPDGYMCDRIAVAGAGPWFDAGEVDGRRVRDQLKLEFRVGPGADKEIRPRRDIRDIVAEHLPLAEAQVWPWIFSGWADDPPPLGMNVTHACSGPIVFEPGLLYQPHEFTMLDAPLILIDLAGRMRPRRIRMFVTKCPTCRRIFWFLHVDK